MVVLGLCDLLCDCWFGCEGGVGIASVVEDLALGVCC